MPDKFEKFCKKVNTEYVPLSSYHHQRIVSWNLASNLKSKQSKCSNINFYTHLAFLQIRTMPLGPELLIPAILLFNYPARSIMQIVNKLLISLNNDDEHYKALVKRQKNDSNHDTPRNYTFILIGSTVAVQWEEGDRLTHGTIVQKGDHNHNNRSYTICMTEAGQLITRNSKHLKPTPTTAKQYLQDQFDRQTKTDPLEDFLKQCESNAQHNKANIYSEHVDNSPNENITRNM